MLPRQTGPGDSGQATPTRLPGVLTDARADKLTGMRISVFGCGYLGTVHAACMATLGHEVVGIDVVEEQVATLSRGEPPFYEPGLPDLLDEAMATGRLTFTTDASSAADAEVHFICVGTPQRRGRTVQT